MSSQAFMGGSFIRLLSEHVSSLPMQQSAGRALKHWPWVLVFVVIPAGGAVVIDHSHLADAAQSSAGLLAGIGIFGGFLFQVLASTASRIAGLADGAEGEVPSSYRIALIRRLDIVRANIAYASFLCVVFVGELGISAFFKHTPTWLTAVTAFLLLHVLLTLVLVLFRINAVGQDDRIGALTTHAQN